MSSQEIRLAKKRYEDEGLKPSQIADRLGRNDSNITRLSVKQLPRKEHGRRHLLSEPQVDLLVRRLHEPVTKANAEYHVTAQMLRKSTKERVILQALHARGIYFCKLREKPLLTADDIRARFAFAKKFKGKPASWWNNHIHAFLDGKHFKTYITSDARKLAANINIAHLLCIGLLDFV
ncbi:F52C9.6 [Symbiodinium pilosum]|uniref:F52C9.6 protein n=1 Tax=Symbiodinium pilosum TaxID=2952 RepID=A0A812MKD8_SYMPI|nr:F52C9.6 [Symbiodinium pilosum]